MMESENWIYETKNFVKCERCGSKNIISDYRQLNGKTWFTVTCLDCKRELTALARSTKAEE